MNLAAKILGTGFEALIALTLANSIAQYIKFFRDWRRYGRSNLALLFSTGGMPSSHSSTVTALTTSLGLAAGWSSPVFALSACFATITMFDAAGLRRAASMQAQALNEIIRELLAPDHRLSHNKLKELLGHTPKEVLVGAVLGVAVSLALHWVLVELA